MKKKVLFISHDGRRSGGPMLLLSYLRWLAEKNLFEITILLKVHGELEKEFGKLGTVLVYNKNITSFNWRLKQFLENRHKTNLIKNINQTSWKCVFSNTITNGDILEHLNLPNTPIYSYIHEMAFSYDLYEKRNVIKGTIDKTSFYFCGSSIVKKDLQEKYKISKDKISVVHSFIENPDKNIKEPQKRIALLKDLNIPRDAFVVGMMGTLDWRKGGDFFLNTANLLKNENIYFVWVGIKDNSYFQEFLYDIQMMNCGRKIKLIQASNDHKKYFQVLDVFFLSSREDPYPIVMTEASSFGIPIISFENTGGSNEFLDDKTGFIVPYGDITMVTEKILDLKDNQHLYNQISTNIRKKSIETHDININGTKILNKIDKN